jgi:hypothetical protein
MLGFSLASCGGHTTGSAITTGSGSGGSEAQTSSGGNPDATAIEVEGSTSGGSGGGNEDGCGVGCKDADGSADSGTGLPAPTHCVSSTRYATVEPCPQLAQGVPYRIFECDSDCLAFASVYDGPRCVVGGWTDANVTPLTEAGTIVLCCPGDLDASSFECEPPFM